MKHFYFLISFMFVNVSAKNQNLYKREVLLTNLSIERAFNMNNITVGGNFVANNGLEHVIEIMVNDKKRYKNFAKLNFMVAVPEHLLILRSINESRNWRNMTRAMIFQELFRWQIKHTLGIDYPKINENQDFGALDLKVLADERRKHIVPVLKHLIRRILDEPVQNEPTQEKPVKDEFAQDKPLQNEPTRVESVQDETAQVEPVQDDGSLYALSRLIGLYISTQIQKTYITSIDIDSINKTCTLWHGAVQIEYRKNNGVWELIREDGTVQLLDEQLIR